MSIYKPTWLYIKQHNQTGLKYFGKTVRKDPGRYKGSGTYWKSHLKEHGNDVSTIWCHLYIDENDLFNDAVAFSTSHDIIDSTDANGIKIWANLMVETGIDATGTIGHVVTSHTRKILSEKNIGKKLSQGTKDKMSASLKVRIRSQQTFNKISASLTGRTLSPSHCDNIRKSKKGQHVGDKNPFFGKTHTEEAKRKISAAVKSRPSESIETRQKKSNIVKMLKWWTNGITLTRAIDCPGEGWTNGRKLSL